MKPFVIKSISCLKGEITLPGDKSIAHRSLIISTLCRGTTRIKNFPANKDCLATLNALKKLGIRITYRPTRTQNGSLDISVYGRGLQGFKKPKGPIFVGNSGTTLRILLGVLAGQSFSTKLVAGESLSQRPMLRVTQPLRVMGAKINSKLKTQNSKLEEYPPITIKGGNLQAITYKMPVASAQVKSAILLAGLYPKEETRVIELIPTRDHTERMLRLFKARIKLLKNRIVIEGRHKLVSPRRIDIPADISSAAFFLVMAALLPYAQILIRNISLNPTRIGIIKVLKRMGAKIQTQKPRPKTQSFEPTGDIVVKSSALKGTIVRKEEIPSLIDELPILMVAACFAKGRTVFEGVGELRVKETDRVRSMSENLIRMGAYIDVERSGKSENIIIIRGLKHLHGAKVKSFGDHRTAISMIVAGCAATGQTHIDDISCIDKSFPNFLRILDSISK